mmetsp:Transcript_15566/g.32932  ORF Transcript_15566/g.32932 Transcript_15566/m.32932 type:complete len:83 (-) Transcript_15566:255-503(-)
MSTPIFCIYFGTCVCVCFQLLDYISIAYSYLHKSNHFFESSPSVLLAASAGIFLLLAPASGGNIGLSPLLTAFAPALNSSHT